MRLAYLNFSVFVFFGGSFLSFYALLDTEVFPENIELLGFSMSREVFTGATMSVFAAMVGLLSSRLGKIHQLIGFNRVLALGFVCYGSALFMLQYTQQVWGATLCVMFLGAAHGVTVPSIIALHTKLAPEGMTAAYVTLNSLVFRLGQAVGPVLMTLVYLHFGLQAIFIAAAILALPSGVIALLTNWRGPAEVPGH